MRFPIYLKLNLNNCFSVIMITLFFIRVLKLNCYININIHQQNLNKIFIHNISIATYGNLLVINLLYTTKVYQY